MLKTMLALPAAESANLDANVPVSDMVEFMQPVVNGPEGVSTGDQSRGPLEEISDWIKSIFASKNLDTPEEVGLTQQRQQEVYEKL